jgi:hypothetical protein
MFSNGKSPGPDDITPELLKALPDNMLFRLVMIMKASVELVHLPDSWLEGEMIFLSKPGKDDYTDQRAHRPITLTPFVFKALERVNLWNLEQTDLKKKNMHKRQYAFRPGRSCDNALADAVDFIEGGKRDGHVTGVLFLDIKGAFDHLDPEAAIQAMRDRGITPWFINWYGHGYLKNRNVRAKLNGKTLRRWLKRGSPQGGVFSPILWNIVFDELLYIINSGPFRGIGFADDGTIMIQGPDEHTIINLFQQLLKKVEKWAKKFGL